MVNTESQANKPISKEDMTELSTLRARMHSTRIKLEELTKFLEKLNEPISEEDIAEINTQLVNPNIKPEELREFLQKFNQPNDDLVSTMTKVELKALIAETMRDVIQQENSRSSLKTQIEKIKSLKYDSDAKPFWQIAAELSARVPEEEWAKLPKDASTRVDEYLYGSPVD
jgi:membrane protease subunit (stomatin/prohibitin family)